MSGNKVIKSVSFNLTVKEDQAMLKHIKRKNFSGYVKKLIMKEMNKDVEVEEVEVAATEPKIETPQEKLDRLKTKRSESKPAPPNP